MAVSQWSKDTMHAMGKYSTRWLWLKQTAFLSCQEPLRAVFSKHLLPYLNMSLSFRKTMLKERREHLALPAVSKWELRCLIRI